MFMPRMTQHNYAITKPLVGARNPLLLIKSYCFASIYFFALGELCEKRRYIWYCLRSVHSTQYVERTM